MVLFCQLGSWRSEGDLFLLQREYHIPSSVGWYGNQVICYQTQTACLQFTIMIMITHNCCAQCSQSITIKCVCFCSGSKSIPCMFWFHGIFLTFTEELVSVRNTSQAGFWITVLFGWTSEGRTWCVKPQCKRQCNACSCGPHKHDVRFGWMSTARVQSESMRLLLVYIRPVCGSMEVGGKCQVCPGGGRGNLIGSGKSVD